MFKKLLKSSLAIVVTAGLSFSFVQGTSAAEEKIDGKCTVKIDKNKHTSDSPAKGSGKCGKVVEGYYGAGQYHVDGYYTGIVVNNEKFEVTIMPGFYRYEVTVNTASTATVKMPTVSSVDTSDTKVTGTATAGAKVTVKAGSKTLGSVIANSKGSYSVKVKKQKAGTRLSIKATKYNVSKSKTVIVKYTAPKVNRVKATTTKITGSTIAGAKVIVKAGSKTLGIATANSKGSYSVKIKKQKAGVKLNVTAVKGKKTSETRIVTVQK